MEEGMQPAPWGELPQREVMQTPDEVAAIGADARAVPLRVAHGLEGGRGEANSAPKAEGHTPAPPAGSICGSRWPIARMVRNRAMADVTGAARAPAIGIPWHLSREAAAYTATPGEGVAADGGAKNGLWRVCDGAAGR